MCHLHTTASSLWTFPFQFSLNFDEFFNPRKTLLESITRLADSHCDQRQMLKGIVELFVIHDRSWWGGGWERGGSENKWEQSKYVKRIAISGPSVLSAWRKSQTETVWKQMLLVGFNTVPLKISLVSLIHSLIHVFLHSFISTFTFEFLLWHRLYDGYWGPDVKRDPVFN